MKVKDLNTKVGRLRRKNQLNESNDSLRDMLSMIFDVIEKFESNRKVGKKDDREKIDVLKNIITDMMKDSEQKHIIRGKG